MYSILVDRVNRLRRKTWMTPKYERRIDRSELFCITHSTFTITTTKYRFANSFKRLNATQNRTVLDLENTIITNTRRLPINYCLDQIAIDNSNRPSELKVITDKNNHTCALIFPENFEHHVGPKSFTTYSKCIKACFEANIQMPFDESLGSL